MESAARLEQADAVTRLWSKDPSLFSDDPAVQELVANRLGWLGLAERALPIIERAQELGWPGEEARAEGISDIVLLGMGGSSLAPLTMREILPSDPMAPGLSVLDTSSPTAVEYVLTGVDPSEAAFVVASKSGGTIEPLSLYAVFREWMDDALGREEAGRRFVATTDPGSPLEELAREEGFREVFPTPRDVGGRYSALTPFGLLPAALAGIDISRIVERAAEMENACRQPVNDNPGARLAAWMHDAYEDGRDKLTLVTSEGLSAFGLWAEQLIAESTGKDGKGVVPVLAHGPKSAEGFGEDRMVAVVRWARDRALSEWAAELSDRLPVIELVLDDEYDLGAEFVRWEVATALLGHLMGINPFDEPNVTEAKEKTAAILAGEIEVPRPSFSVDGVEVTYPAGPPPSQASDLPSLLRDVISSVGEGDYLAVLVFVPGDESFTLALARATDTVSRRTGRTAVLSAGPRYLHSTGQLHKGGPNSGVFLVVSVHPPREIPVPGKDYSLADLIAAQAAGDMLALAASGRRVVGLQLPDARVATLKELGEALERATR
jgi:glucose-6-phosphate isomerase